ncbi:MAG TPA: hypothetical protein PK284_08160 [Bacteroidales bacterium]|nr:hypothetical protein [Bacteroidales bacterium]
MPIHKGVRNIPSRLDTDALNMAAGTFPRPMETRTTEEEIVVGKAARKKVPDHKGASQVPPANVFTSKTSAGNSMKVTACVTTCRRQFASPVLSCAGLSLSP